MEAERLTVHFEERAVLKRFLVAQGINDRVQRRLIAKLFLEKAVIDSAVAPSVGRNDFHPELPAALDQLIENAIRLLLGTKAFHPHDDRMQVGTHIANDQDCRARRPAAPINSDDELVAALGRHVGLFPRHRTILAASLDLRLGDHMIAEGARQPEALVAETSRIVGGLPREDLVGVEPRHHEMIDPVAVSPS